MNKILGLLMILGLQSHQANASGCLPDDQLISETIVYKVGEFNGSYSCVKGYSCTFSIQSKQGSPYEYHYLMGAMTRHEGETFSKHIETVDAYIYRQHWEGSCGDQYRYVFGADYESQRYRAQSDLP